MRRDVGIADSEIIYAIAEKAINYGRFEWNYNDENIFYHDSTKEFELKVIISSVWDSDVKGESDWWFKVIE